MRRQERFALLRLLEATVADTRIPDALRLGELVPWQRKARDHDDGTASHARKPREATAESDEERRMRKELCALLERPRPREILCAFRDAHRDAATRLLALAVDAEHAIARRAQHRDHLVPAAWPQPALQHARTLHGDADVWFLHGTWQGAQPCADGSRRWWRCALEAKADARDEFQRDDAPVDGRLVWVAVAIAEIVRRIRILRNRLCKWQRRIQ